jgi:5-methylcytosine-specific restriction protein A
VVELPPRTTSAHGLAVERDPEGFPLCRQCKGSIRTGKRPKQRTFCGPDCVHLWKLKSDPGYQAQHVLIRDQAVCATCGVDCIGLLIQLKLERLDEALQRHGERIRHANLETIALRFPVFVARCDQLALPRNLRGLVRRLWEMDHTIPVIEGGGSCGLENLRTLCWACHRKATAELAARRAEARKAAANG